MFGDWHLALASYNGGPGRVQKAMKRAGEEDFWTLDDQPRFLPRETRDYVPLILAAVVIARNPAQYGMDIQPFQPGRREGDRAEGGRSAAALPSGPARRSQAIQDLNPELRRWTTPVRARDYELKVPTGTADIVRARLAEANPDELVTLNRHTVKKGETLLTISRKLKVSRADLADANYIPANARLSAGQQLIIPRAPTLLLAARADNPIPLTESRSVDAVVASRAVAPRAERTPEVKVVHLVKRGETLSSIAKLYRTTASSVKQWNKLRGNVVQIGQKLTIFQPRRGAAVATN